MACLGWPWWVSPTLRGGLLAQGAFEIVVECQSFIGVQKCADFNLSVAAPQSDVVFDRAALWMQVDSDPIAVRLPLLAIPFGIVTGQLGLGVVNRQFLKHFAASVADMQRIPDPAQHHQKERQKRPEDRRAQNREQRQGHNGCSSRDEKHEILAQKRPIGPEAQLPIRFAMGWLWGPFIGHRRDLADTYA